MHIAVLGASGATGHQIASQALERGHTVTAIARTPDRLDLRPSARLHPVHGDVRQPASIAQAIAGTDVVLSGLGVAKGDHGTLLAGAHALIDGGAARIIWLGAYGTGVSAASAGLLTRTTLALALRGELDDKIAADTAVIAADGTVFHAARLTNGPLSAEHRTVPLADAPRHLMPPGISRATVAAAMLDEAESASHPGQILIPLSH